MGPSEVQRPSVHVVLRDIGMGPSVVVLEWDLGGIGMGPDRYCMILLLQLFDATSGKMKLLMIHACEPSVKSWMGGNLLNNRNAIIWAKVSVKS